MPSSFIRTRIIEQYLDIIKSYWYVQNLKINDIKIVVTKDEKKKISNFGKKNLESQIEKNSQDVFKTISSDLDSRFTFLNFIVGKPNELALLRLEEFLNQTTSLLTLFFCMERRFR